MKKLLICLLLLGKLPTALAWGDLGHETVGEIAERNLTAEAKQAILDIVGPEQLALTAIWADSVKDDPSYKSFEDYHFIDIKTNGVHEDQGKKTVVGVFKNFPRVLLSATAPRTMKIVALRYIVHTIGDIHQPLHVGNTYDKGGNTCKVKFTPTQDAVLHQVWDSKLIDLDIAEIKKRPGTDVKKYFGFIEYANDLIASQPLTPEQAQQITELDFSKWIAEAMSFRDLVYPEGNNAGTESLRPYCQKDADPATYPILSDEYKAKSIKLIRERILIGGLRLAKVLNDLFATNPTPGTNASLTKEEIIKQLTFL